MRHEQEILAHLPCNVYVLSDRARVVCVIVSALRRYAADHQAVLNPPLQLHVGSTLQVAEREMHWFALCGSDAHEVELLDAVSSPVASADQAAALLRTDISGVVLAATATESSISSEAIPAEFPR